MSKEREKQLAIELLAEKIERISGKKVVLQEAKKPVEKLIINKGDYDFISADYKDIDGLIDEFKKAIEKLFKGYVYEAPSTQGSDTFGFFVTKRKFSNKELTQVDDESLGR